ncbi:MAG: hypothetical protein V4547_16415 [Bacteroidota bacterium]
MMTTSKVKSCTINQRGGRDIKVEQYGAKTALEVAPFGEDSVPMENMTAIYANTGTNGEPVILGYINESQMAQTGEKRLYSLKPDGSLGGWVWIKNDGTMELSGNADNLVRWEKLNAAVQQLAIDYNIELQKISLAIAAVGGTYTAMTVNPNITPAKVLELKCS